METSKPLTEPQKKAWTKHVLDCFPHEACAFIVNGRLRPVANVAPPRPEGSDEARCFAVSALDRLEAEKGTITGFLHSHCLTPLEAARHFWPINWPSAADMNGWMADNVRWGISGCDGDNVSEPIWLDENTIAPLEGRPFIHGIWDCYGAVRDWFRLNRNITLPNYARDMEWWNKGEDLYTQHFEEAGFVEISGIDVVPGDCGLVTVNRNLIVSHAVVIADAGRIYHHAFSRSGQQLSGYTDRGRWVKHIVKYVRYAGKEQE